MKIILLLILSTYISIYVAGQNSFTLTYDNNGNLIDRKLKVIPSGGPKIAAPQAKDTLDEASKNIKVYPNPTKMMLQVDYISTAQSVSIDCSIVNLNGNLLERRSLRSSQNSIDMSSYPTGIYLLRIVDLGKVYQWKIIKE